MSLYGQAVVSGMGSAQLLLTGENAGTKAAFNEAYSLEAQRINLAYKRNALEQNIAAIKQDKILSNAQIEQNQASAQASAKLAAAVAGVSGTSVNDVSNDIDVNAARAKEAVEKRASQDIETVLGNIYSTESARLAVPETKVDPVGDLLMAFSSFRPSDLDVAGSGGAASE